MESNGKGPIMGDLIPANEVDICGLEIQPTKEFLERLKRHSNGCSRQYWSVKSTPKEADKEFADFSCTIVK